STGAASGSSAMSNSAVGFACECCGACCRWPGLVRLSALDVDRLAAHLRLDPATFVERFCKLAPNRAQLALNERADGACVFLDGRICAVYPARPEQCRAFPLQWWRAGCPAAPAPPTARGSAGEAAGAEV
ncbi:MAG: YkgJ family cysteine cluster protein, partial [Kiritimatiellae bacterium]|nr:YkgJ family cysteine cluster protein [Kiritimatiellia bacterium]